MLIHVWSSCSDTNNFFGGVVTPSEKLKVCYLWIIGSLNDDGLLWNPWRGLFNIYDSFNYLSSLLDIKTFFKLSGCPWNPFPAQDLEESEQMLHQAQAGGVPALSHRTLEMANWSWPERWREGVGRIIGTQQRKNDIAYSGIQHCKLTPISSILANWRNPTENQPPPRYRKRFRNWSKSKRMRRKRLGMARLRFVSFSSSWGIQIVQCLMPEITGNQHGDPTKWTFVQRHLFMLRSGSLFLFKGGVLRLCSKMPSRNIKSFAHVRFPHHVSYNMYNSYILLIKVHTRQWKCHHYVYICN